MTITLLNENICVYPRIYHPYGSGWQIHFNLPEELYGEMATVFIDGFDDETEGPFYLTFEIVLLDSVDVIIDQIVEKLQPIMEDESDPRSHFFDDCDKLVSLDLDTNSKVIRAVFDD